MFISESPWANHDSDHDCERFCDPQLCPEVPVISFRIAATSVSSVSSPSEIDPVLAGLFFQNLSRLTIDESPLSGF